MNAFDVDPRGAFHEWNNLEEITKIFKDMKLSNEELDSITFKKDGDAEEQVKAVINALTAKERDTAIMKRNAETAKNHDNPRTIVYYAVFMILALCNVAAASENENFLKTAVDPLENLVYSLEGDASEQKLKMIESDLMASIQRVELNRRAAAGNSTANHYRETAVFGSYVVIAVAGIYLRAPRALQAIAWLAYIGWSLSYQS